MSVTPDPESPRAVAPDLVKVLPYLRHRATCLLRAVRDNPPWDKLCDCGLREAYAATHSPAPRNLPSEPWHAAEDEFHARAAASGDGLREAAQEVIERWMTPNLANAMAFDEAIDKLRAALAANPEVAAGVGLDVAWREAEAALPDGWHIGRVVRTAPSFEESWWVEAQKSGGLNRNYDTRHTAWHDTLEAALRALPGAFEKKSKRARRRAPQPDAIAGKPTAADLRGMAPDIAGDQSSEDYIRSIRDEPDAIAGSEG